MKRSGPIKRKTPIRQKRSKPRRGEPTNEEKEVLRLETYSRAGGVCELKLLEDCIQGVLPYEGETPWDHGHLVHIKARRVYGWDISNLAWGCWRCHLIGMHEKGRKWERPPEM